MQKKCAFILSILLSLLYTAPAIADIVYESWGETPESSYYSESSNYSSPYYSDSNSFDEYAENNIDRRFGDPYYDDRYAQPPPKRKKYSNKRSRSSSSYFSRLPQRISAGEKVILIDPRVHAWGAYSASGQLIRAGIATAGSKWCSDIGRACRTKAGTFRIFSLGSSDCYSRKYPVGRGGAPMPYCMFFNGGQGLHGSNEVAEANLSHGCVRVRVGDAEWLRYNFAGIGTKVIVRPY